MQSKISVRRQSTEKVLKASKNTSHNSSKKNTKGSQLEKSWSFYIHSRERPLLISSLVLREYNCGQVDVASYQNQHIKLYEVKSRPEGLSKQQYLRLRDSLELLTHSFGASGQILIVKNLPKD